MKKSPFPDQQFWSKYGIEQGFDKTNPTSLHRSPDLSERVWYDKGLREGWVKQFTFTRKKERPQITFSDHESWHKYGIEHEFDKTNPTSLAKGPNPSKRSWYRKGRREGWLKDFQFAKKWEKCIITFPDQQSWYQYGIDNQFDTINPTSVKESPDPLIRYWYGKGLRKCWTRDFPFARKYEKLKFLDYESWHKYGIKQGFDKINPASLSESQDPSKRSWINKGRRGDWIKDFPFTRKHEEFQITFPNQQSWHKYGIEQGFDTINPTSLQKSPDLSERSWIRKGRREGWLKDFQFARKHEKSQITFSDQQSWHKYGIDNEFNKTNPTSLSESQDPLKRYWYRKGRREGWLKDFPFTRKYNEFPDQETWYQYGIEQGFDQTNPASLSESPDPLKRYWYDKGARKDWIKQFPFARKQEKPQITFSDQQSWHKYGIDHGFDQTNPASLSESPDPLKRYWIKKGYKEDWIKQFPFTRINQKIRSPNSFIRFAENESLLKQVLPYLDESDILEFVRILHPERYSPDLHDVLFLPCLSDYLGSHRAPRNGRPPIPTDDVLEELPLDKEEVLRRLFVNKGIEYYRKVIGPCGDGLPSTLTELDGRVQAAHGNARLVYSEILGYFEQLNKLAGRYLE